MKRQDMRSKHPLTIRWCHWVNFPLLALMIWSGLWIYWANDVYRIALGSLTLFHFFPKRFCHTFGLNHRLAQGMARHFFFMWFFAVNGIVYVTYTLISGDWRYLLPNRHSFCEAALVGLHDPHLWMGTLYCYEMNGAALTEGHGAPLRLVTPVKYGVKNIKRIGTIGYSTLRPADYWAEQGYDWYIGL